MTTRRAALAAIGVIVGALAFAAACHEHGSAYSRLLPDPARASRQIQDACQLTAAKCTTCHPIDRAIATNRFDAPQWEAVVRRMRLKPSSGITEDESAAIVSCLANRDTASAERR